MHAHEVEMSIWENSGDWPKNARLAIEEIADQRNALRDEVAELKRKIAEVEGERDALRELNAEMLAALNALLTRVERDEVQSIWMPDHACKQCVPGGDIVVPGFKCGLHAARAVVDKIDSPAK